MKQTGGFMFPVNRPCPSTPQSLTPKMMQLRFGANSPRPSPFYSPSSNSVQHFRCVVMFGFSQICLICGVNSSAKFEHWVYLWPGSLVRSSWHSPGIHKFHTIPEVLITYEVNLAEWKTLPSGDKWYSCTFQKLMPSWTDIDEDNFSRVYWQILHVEEKAESWLQNVGCTLKCIDSSPTKTKKRQHPLQAIAKRKAVTRTTGTDYNKN